MPQWSDRIYILDAFQNFNALRDKVIVLTGRYGIHDIFALRELVGESDHDAPGVEGVSLIGSWRDAVCVDNYLGGVVELEWLLVFELGGYQISTGQHLDCSGIFKQPEVCFAYRRDLLFVQPCGLKSAVNEPIYCRGGCIGSAYQSKDDLLELSFAVPSPTKQQE